MFQTLSAALQKENDQFLPLEINHTYENVNNGCEDVHKQETSAGRLMKPTPKKRVSEIATDKEVGEVAPDKEAGKVVLQQSHCSYFAILEKRRSLLQERQEKKNTCGTLLLRT